MDRAMPLYLHNPRCLRTHFDPRCPGTEQRLRRKLAAWRGFARAEMILDGRAALVMWPGGASGGRR